MFNYCDNLRRQRPLTNHNLNHNLNLTIAIVSFKKQKKENTGRNKEKIL